MQIGICCRLSARIRHLIFQTPPGEECPLMPCAFLTPRDCTAGHGPLTLLLQNSILPARSCGKQSTYPKGPINPLSFHMPGVPRMKVVALDTSNLFPWPPALEVGWLWAVEGECSCNFFFQPLWHTPVDGITEISLAGCKDCQHCSLPFQPKRVFRRKNSASLDGGGRGQCLQA